MEGLARIALLTGGDWLFTPSTQMRIAATTDTMKMNNKLYKTQVTIR
jgi:hypothetical protein